MSKTATRELPADVRARLDLRSSGAAGKHGDRRTRRLRTRDSQKRAALRDWR